MEITKSDRIKVTGIGVEKFRRFSRLIKIGPRSRVSTTRPDEKFIMESESGISYIRIKVGEDQEMYLVMATETFEDVLDGMELLVETISKQQVID